MYLLCSYWNELGLLCLEQLNKHLLCIVVQVGNGIAASKDGVLCNVQAWSLRPLAWARRVAQTAAVPVNHASRAVANDILTFELAR